jgi:2-keto-4-pentenoate hydratase/2-oxohepta-3-ene-1,7-dioic acid hydratase in catechol pathway
MTHWVRFRHGGDVSFGVLEGGVIDIFSGDMFGTPKNTGKQVALASVELEAPCVPGKMLALWNNFHGLAAKLGQAMPKHPLYFAKSTSSVLAPGETLRRPASYAGKIVYEGELCIVIGKTTRGISMEQAGKHIFGYTCVNDVTAADILNDDASFAQWMRAKSFDGFGPVGPFIATGIDPHNLVVRTILNGQERQNYPVADMIFSPQEIVSRISHDMTLEAGDLICCGTSLGVGVMKEAVNEVTVSIQGIGDLHNRFVQQV